MYGIVWVYSSTFTINLSHPCRQIDQSHGASRSGSWFVIIPKYICIIYIYGYYFIPPRLQQTTRDPFFMAPCFFFSFVRVVFVVFDLFFLGLRDFVDDLAVPLVGPQEMLRDFSGWQKGQEVREERDTYLYN